jgi:DNA recombination protein Rad52
VRRRDLDGTAIAFLEGWHVIDEANRIFGFDGWDREMMSAECIWSRENGPRFSAAYLSRVRVRVRAGDVVILREGSGAGEATCKTPGQAHELAAKSAETDATKRALVTFGNVFGLSLYKTVVEMFPDLPGHELPRDTLLTEVSQASSEPIRRKPKRAIAKSNDGTFPPAGKRPEDKMAQPATEPSNNPPSPPGFRCQEGSPVWRNIKPLEEAQRLELERLYRVDKSQLLLSEPKRIRNAAHLAYVAAKPCLICGRNRSHAHHLKFAQPTALGRKVSDEFTVPLCSTHHRELHQHGDERVWWITRNIDPIEVAARLWNSRSGSAGESF